MRSPFRSTFIRPALLSSALLSLGLGLTSATTTSAKSPPKPLYRSYSDSLRVPTASELQRNLKYLQPACAKPQNGSVTFVTALADARKLVAKGGASAVKKIEFGADSNPQRAEIDAVAAMANGNAAGALAALLSAYDHDKNNATHLRNIAGVLGNLAMPEDALAFLKQADALKAKPQSPMGISQTDSAANNRAYDLMQLGQYKQAAIILQPLVSHDPRLSEAKTNLGMTDVCLGALPKAASMIVAGYRRNSHSKSDTQGAAPDAYTQDNVGQFLDLSHGHTWTLPYLDYPKSVAEIEKTGSTYYVNNGMGTTVQYFDDLATSDMNKSGSYLQKAGVLSGPPVLFRRYIDLENAAYDGKMGGFQSLEDAATNAEDDASILDTDVFSGQCGLACQKYQDIENANPGADDCSVIWPQMSAWITSETKKWAADMQVYDIAERKEFAAQSKWATSVFANFSNPDTVKALMYGLDSTKQSEMYLMTSMIGDWEEGVWLYDPVMHGGSCPGSLGAGDPVPADTKIKTDICPKGLTDHGFQFSVGIVSLATDCETISVTVAEEGLGPFGRVTVNRSGNVTITMGAQAGVSMGPMAAGVEAGVYVTVGSSGIVDAGVTASASAAANVGNIQMTVNQAGYTGSFIDSSTTASGFAQ